MKRIGRCIGLVAIVGSLGGCGGMADPGSALDAPGVSPLAGGSGGLEPGPISTNGLSAEDLQGVHQNNLSALANEKLSESNLLARQLGAQAEYLVKCALASGQSLNVGGDTLKGRIGLAPGWISKPLSESEQRWMTACLLAHVNASGQHTKILLAGNHSSLHALGGEGDYAFEEAAFYGNLFDAGDVVPGGASPPAAGQTSYACGGADLSPNAVAALHARMCTDPSNCTIALPGLCVDVDTDWNHCGADGCYSTGFLASNPPSYVGFGEVIMVYLSSADRCNTYGICE